MTTTEVVLATLTGFAAGALFKFVEVPIPAPPNLAGVMGIVGIFLGFQVMQELGLTLDDLFRVLGLA
ncbi:XapX domain-containing protein [Haloarchaeobius sp. HRN-SO-5]|uniref:XapX domain-containing protein n=1 Tax=Haloarchaeobius sp. HRN-SO-5 TaxID=3446118 RepID=UPI003EB75EC0